MDLILKKVDAPPPISTTIPYSSLEMEAMKKIVHLKRVSCNKIEEMVAIIHLIKEELSLLSRLLYKGHNRFRNDKGYKDLRILEKSLLKLLNFDIPNRVRMYFSFIPDFPPVLIVPSLEMLDYTLCQLAGTGCLLSRIEMLVKNGALLNVQRLVLGHFWGVAAQNLGSIARILMLCRQQLNIVNHCYVTMLTMSELLKSGENESYPKNLNEFMPMDMIEKSDNSSHPLLNFTVKDMDETVDDFLDIGVAVKRPVELNAKDSSIVHIQHTQKNFDKNQETVVPKTVDILSNIHSLDEFKSFLSEESEKRKTSRKSSYTRKLDQSEWKALKKTVLENLKPNTPNKSIKFCRKLIRSKLNS